MYHSTYLGADIWRLNSGYRLPYEAYAGGRFVYADSLAGIRAAIRDAIKGAR